MSDKLEEIITKYGMRYEENPDIITGVIPEWALPEEALEQYKNFEGASDSFDNSELEVLTATSEFNAARGKDEQAVRDAVIAGKKPPAYVHEQKAENKLKSVLHAQKVIAGIKNQEAKKLVNLMRENRFAIHSAMEHRVNKIVPEIRERLDKYEQELRPLYAELSEALAPAELLRTLDSRQPDEIGGSAPLIIGPDFDYRRANLNNLMQTVKNLSNRGVPNRIRLKDPHGNIGEHDLTGPTPAETERIQAGIQILKDAGWKEVPYSD